MKRIDIAGKKFGEWEVLYFIGGRNSLWRCKCNLCGKKHSIQGSALRTKKTRKCHACQNKISCIRHGMRFWPEYRIWSSIITRCCNERNKAYKYYGARGITICEKWKSSFPAFIKDMGRRPSPELTVERIDNDKGYIPGNCKWATRKEQVNNRRNTIRITFEGETKTLIQWALKIGITDEALRYRLKKYTLAKALLTPKQRP